MKRSYLNILFEIYPAPFFVDPVSVAYMGKMIDLSGVQELIFIVNMEIKATEIEGLKSTYFDGNGLFESLLVRLIERIDKLDQNEDKLLFMHILNFYQLLKYFDLFDDNSYEYIFERRTKIQNKISHFYKKDIASICRNVRDGFPGCGKVLVDNLEILFSSVILYLYVKYFI